MRLTTLLRRSLTHYWRTNLAVVLGAATAVTVLAGALLVGDSVRASLRDLFLLRLGQVSYVVASDLFFREAQVGKLEELYPFGKIFSEAAPLIELEGIITHEPTGRRALQVRVYGVDERFWRFHRSERSAPQGREAFLSANLAAELGAAPGDTVLVRLEKPSLVHVDSLHGRKDQLGRSLRLRGGAVLSAEELGEFSLRPSQGAVRAVFVPLRRLQQDLDQEGRVNRILVSEPDPKKGNQTRALEALLHQIFELEDVGLRMRELPAHGERLETWFSLESDRLLLDDRMAESARQAAQLVGMKTLSVFTYLANTIRVDGRAIPYSLVAAMDPLPFAADTHTPAVVAVAGAADSLPSIWLNAWAQQELRAQPGQIVNLDYYIWESGALRTDSASFVFRGAVPLEGLGADRDLAPHYPGLTDADDVGDWDPPFPVDLKLIRPRDEAYWDRYRAAPKAFIPLAAGQRLWGSPYGNLTSLRFHPPVGRQEAALFFYRQRLRAALNLSAAGLTVYPARAEGIQASVGAVNFGEYFLYFSSFLVVSGVLLTGLFFRLGVEQRLREIGLLAAVGFPQGMIGNLFLAEGVVLATAGSWMGLGGALGYGSLMMYGLRTWWVGAVGTSFLYLHVSMRSLLLGGFGGVLAAVLAVAWAVWSTRRASPRSLLTGAHELTGVARPRASRPAFVAGTTAGAAALMLLTAAATQRIGYVTGFFGSGTLLLAALVCFLWYGLDRKRRKAPARTGWAGLSLMAFHNAAWRPGRSLLCIVLLASATFVIVALGTFRRDDTQILDAKSGTGGFPLLAHSLLPIPYDLNSSAGKESLSPGSAQEGVLQGARFLSFRVRPGDDASCLNLYQPRTPRVLGVPDELIRGRRFSFQDSLPSAPSERDNPWRLLEADADDGTIPAITDANSLTYVLHAKLGDEIIVSQGTSRPVRLRLVGSLRDSIFQSELLISDRNFLRAFPEQAGYRFFLIDVPAEKAGQVAAALEERLKDHGFDAQPAGERLAAYRRVENTYLSTFQVLGGLGLVLGTLGLAAVLLRNVLERRRELALLRAVGYRPSTLAYLVLVENVLLLVLGLLSGIVSAALAVAPAFSSRGAAPPVASTGWVLAAVFLTGLAASLLAVRVVVRAPLLEALRTE